MGELTYKYDRHDKGRPILKTYYRGFYCGESVGYYIGRDTLMVYPFRIVSAPPRGVELKRRVYMSEVER